MDHSSEYTFGIIGLYNNLDNSTNKQNIDKNIKTTVEIEQ